jgi:hypothetical protein
MSKPVNQPERVGLLIGDARGLAKLFIACSIVAVHKVSVQGKGKETRRLIAKRLQETRID